ncbi:MAG TPA: AraC family transcriptional regulator [Streptosporangiaceae bacterium]|nr:AraC family transcriptional regulator [Streptosporangiaceae bacterium]
MGIADLWRGTIYLGPGWLVYAGAAGPVARHRHWAVQVLVALSGRFVLRDDGGREVDCVRAVVPSNVAHSTTRPTAAALLLYLEPTSPTGRRLAAGSGPEPRDWSSAGGRLTEIAEHAVRTWADAQALAERLRLPALWPSPSMPTEHPAVTQVLADLPGSLDRPIRVPALADTVGLSAGRLSHLFNTEVGISVPAYVRWLRLREAGTALAAGANLTDAAYAAGFADSAHLSRTFRRAFGMSPSTVVGNAQWEVGPAPGRG